MSSKHVKTARKNQKRALAAAIILAAQQQQKINMNKNEVAIRFFLTSDQGDKS